MNISIRGTVYYHIVLHFCLTSGAVAGAMGVMHFLLLKPLLYLLGLVLMLGTKGYLTDLLVHQFSNSLLTIPHVSPEGVDHIIALTLMLGAIFGALIYFACFP